MNYEYKQSEYTYPFVIIHSFMLTFISIIPHLNLQIILFEKDGVYLYTHYHLVDF